MTEVINQLLTANDTIYTSVINGDYLYVGGAFTLLNEVEVNHIAKVNLQTLEVTGLGSGWDHVVKGIYFDRNNSLYISGRFTTNDGMILYNIAKWNGQEFEKIELDNDINIKSIVFDNDNNLIVSGQFSENGDITDKVIQYVKSVPPLQQQALRYNQGKPNLSYIPIHLLPSETTYATLVEFVKVYEMGAKKYGAYNYIKGAPTDQNISSLLRHYYKGFYDLDEESGLPHYLHVLWNAVTILFNWETTGKFAYPVYETSSVMTCDYHLNRVCRYGLHAAWEFNDKFFREVCNFIYAIILEIQDRRSDLEDIGGLDDEQII